MHLLSTELGAAGGMDGGDPGRAPQTPGRTQQAHMDFQHRPLQPSDVCGKIETPPAACTASASAEEGGSMQQGLCTAGSHASSPLPVPLDRMLDLTFAAAPSIRRNVSSMSRQHQQQQQQQVMRRQWMQRQRLNMPTIHSDEDFVLPAEDLTCCPGHFSCPGAPFCPFVPFSHQRVTGVADLLRQFAAAQPSSAQAAAVQAPTYNPTAKELEAAGSFHSFQGSSGDEDFDPIVIL